MLPPLHYASLDFWIFLFLIAAGVLIIDIIGFILSTPIFWPLLEMHPLNSKLLQIIFITILVCIPFLVIITKKVGQYLDKKRDTEPS